MSNSVFEIGDFVYYLYLHDDCLSEGNLCNPRLKEAGLIYPYYFRIKKAKVVRTWKNGNIALDNGVTVNDFDVYRSPADLMDFLIRHINILEFESKKLDEE